MKTAAFGALLLAATLALAGCEPGQNAAAGNRAAARSAQGGAPPPPPPLTELEKGLKAYESGDRVAALQHFMAGGEQGDPDAQYYAGLMFADGQGAKRNIPEAVRWYEKAAAQNQPDALYALARFYVLNVGVEANPAKAVDLYGRAAEAYPPGEKKDRALEQQQALLAALAPPADKPEETKR